MNQKAVIIKQSSFMKKIPFDLLQTFRAFSESIEVRVQQSVVLPRNLVSQEKFLLDS